MNKKIILSSGLFFQFVNSEVLVHITMRRNEEVDYFQILIIMNKLGNDVVLHIVQINVSFLLSTELTHGNI